MSKINKLLKDIEDKKIWKSLVKFKLLLESEKSLENDRTISRPGNLANPIEYVEVKWKLLLLLNFYFWAALLLLALISQRENWLGGGAFGSVPIKFHIGSNFSILVPELFFSLSDWISADFWK